MDSNALSASLEEHLSLSSDTGFQGFMRAIEPLPDEELTKTIIKAMQKRHKDPPSAVLQQCLGTPVTAEWVS